jgi:exopolysaccharide biosynthesis predicted pyruvyltransferase EpsI
MSMRWKKLKTLKSLKNLTKKIWKTKKNGRRKRCFSLSYWSYDRIGDLFCLVGEILHRVG